MNHLSSLKSRPKRASFRSELKAGLALPAKNILAEEKSSFKNNFKVSKFEFDFNTLPPLRRKNEPPVFPEIETEACELLEVNPKWRVRCAPEIFWPKRKGASSSYWTGTSSTAPSAWGLPAAPRPPPSSPSSTSPSSLSIV